MRTIALAFLLAACGGGGGCHPPEENFGFSASLEIGTGRITPGFRALRNCDDVLLVDDFGLVAHGQRTFEDWVTAYVASTGHGECGCIDWTTPPLSVGVEVLDYRTGEFVLLETEEAVDEFLSRE